MKKKRITDKQRLDFLQGCLGRYTGRVIFRWSGTGRGWRLHETNQDGSTHDVRAAIDAEIMRNERLTK